MKFLPQLQQFPQFNSIPTKKLALAIFGTSLVTCGFILLVLRSILFEFLLKFLLTLGPHSIILGFWKTPPSPLHVNFYLFNWTNPEDVYNHSAKLKFKQMGPYRFNEEKEKVNITWNYHNSTVSYQNLRYWYFDEEKSGGKLNDSITNLNIAFQMAANGAKEWSYFTKKGLSLSLAAISPEIYKTKHVNELLYDGYEDPLLGVLKVFPFLMDHIPRLDKIGYMYPRNGSYTYDGTFNLATGAGIDTGELQNWKYRNHTPYLSGSCGKVHGSMGELGLRNDPKKSYDIFLTDICRPVTLDYEKEDYVDGILGYKYTSQQSMLDNGTNVPGNECYCNGECVPSGLMNVTVCKQNSPAFASLPNFYGADQFYFDRIEGMKPNKSIHDTYVTVDPITGVTLELAVRIQVNILMSPVEHITMFENVPKVFIPIIWFEQTYKAPSIITFLLKLLLSLPIIIIVLGVVMLISGISILIYAFPRRTFKSSFISLNMINNYSQKPHRQSLIDPEQEGLPLYHDNPYVPTTRSKCDYLEVIQDDYDDSD